MTLGTIKTVAAATVLTASAALFINHQNEETLLEEDKLASTASSETAASQVTYSLPGSPELSSKLITVQPNEVTYTIKKVASGGYEATPSHYNDNYLVATVGCNGSVTQKHSGTPTLDQKPECKGE